VGAIHRTPARREWARTSWAVSSLPGSFIAVAAGGSSPKSPIIVLRAELDEPGPAVWRELHVRSDLRLDQLHQVLQAAFSWENAHLHRFSVGGDSFDRDARHFLTPWEIDEGDADGKPEIGVRLGDILRSPGDLVRYLYDYGDHWSVVITCEGASDQPDDTIVWCSDGAGGAPPENSRGEIAGGPDFELAAVQDAVAGVSSALLVPPELAMLLAELFATDGGDEFAASVADLGHGVEVPVDDREAALAPLLWMLQRAADGGIPLTAAGWLTPEIVVHLAGIVPGVGDWFGKNNREQSTVPVADFRAMTMDLKLLRKFKNKLVLTAAGKRAVAGPDELWSELVAAVPVGRNGSFERIAGWLLLCRVAGAHGSVASAMTALGWRTADGHGVHEDMAASAARPLVGLLALLDGTESWRYDERPPGPVSRRFALDVLQRGF
jgi:hypothetical protein